MGKKGLIKNLKNNSTIIDMSTIAPQVTKKISKELINKKCFFIDAPVSGGEIGAINGNLSIMVGGGKRIFNRIKPLLSILGSNITYVGAIVVLCLFFWGLESLLSFLTGLVLG